MLILHIARKISERSRNYFPGKLKNISLALFSCISWVFKEAGGFGATQKNAENPDSVKKGAKTIKQFVTRMRNRFSLN